MSSLLIFEIFCCRKKIKHSSLITLVKLVGCIPSGSIFLMEKRNESKSELYSLVQTAPSPRVSRGQYEGFSTRHYSKLTRRSYTVLFKSWEIYFFYVWQEPSSNPNQKVGGNRSLCKHCLYSFMNCPLIVATVIDFILLGTHLSQLSDKVSVG